MNMFLTALQRPTSSPRANSDLPYLLISLSFGVLVLSLSEALLSWVLLLSGCAVLIRLAAFAKHHSQVSTRTINLLAVLSLFALAWFGLTIGLLNSMINLLAIACSLKLMLIQNRRDFHLLFCTSLFLIGCGFIFALSIYAWVGYTSILFILLLSLALYHSPGKAVLGTSKLVAALLAKALPIAILLFLVLPQLPPLWQMPTAKSQQTGLAESVTPGDIASLAQSSALAFTATFDNAVPPMSALYWRAMTLESFDGKTWAISDKRRQAELQLKSMDRPAPLSASFDFDGNNASTYQLIIEPTQQRWVFGLEVSAPNNAFSNTNVGVQFDYSLRSRLPVMGKKAFYLSYFPDASLSSPLAGFDRQLNLTYPTDSNQKTQAWALTIAQQYDSPQGIAQAIMRYFKEQGFTYTLDPNAMPTSPIDAFLFEERAGFCAHYASAMAFALRVAGIPARMVSGYQGGETLSEGVLQIRQYNAHAWVEALIDGNWVRYDPTSMVAPSRLSIGLEHALAEFGEHRNKSVFSSLTGGALFLEVQSWFRQLDYSWSKWVLGFDKKNQNDLLHKLLGEITSTRLTIILLSTIAVIALLLVIYFVPLRLTSNEIKFNRLFLNAMESLERYTQQPRGAKAARHYFTIISNELNEEIRHIASSAITVYESYHYLPHSMDETKKTLPLKEMKTLVRQLNASINKASVCEKERPQQKHP